MFTTLEVTGCGRTHVIQFDAPRFAVCPETASAFMAMRVAAEADGIDLLPYSSFRDFPTQLRIWNSKFSGKKPLYRLDESVRDFSALNEADLIWAILNWSALPGASRHHWGTEIDVIDGAAITEGYRVKLLPSEVAKGAIFHRLHQWLDERIHEFAFFRPYQHRTGGMYPEPWHLSYAPLSTVAAADLTMDLLANTLRESELLGKDTVLRLLPQIWDRHIRNISPP